MGWPKWQRTLARWLGTDPEVIFRLRGMLYCALHLGRHVYGPNPWYYPGPDCCSHCGRTAPYARLSQ